MSDPEQDCDRMFRNNIELRNYIASHRAISSLTRKGVMRCSQVVLSHITPLTVYSEG